MRGLRKLAATAVAADAAVTSVAARPASHTGPYLAPVQIGVIALLSGPAGSHYRVPARNAAGIGAGSPNAGMAGA